MRELIIKVTCDHCGVETPEGDVTPLEIKAGKQIYESDACISCMESLSTRMRKLRKVQGRRPAPKKDQPDPPSRSRAKRATAR